MNQIRPKPETDDRHTARQCSKCGGTGFYCQGVVNGKPVSNTGFKCYGCDGTGWKVAWKRGEAKKYWDSIPFVKVD